MLGKNSSYTGEIKLSGEAVINSEIKGTIIMQDNSLLTVEREASIEGDIYCKDIEVFGKIRGSINASGSLTVRSCAQVAGKIQAKNLSVYPGAIINVEGHADHSAS